MSLKLRPMSWKDEADEILRRKAEAREMGGAEAVARHHDKGRLTVRERIAGVIDEGTFVEHGAIAGSQEDDGSFTPANYVTGLAEIGGRAVALGGEDFTLKGGSPNAAGLRKSVYAEELALNYKVPLVRLLEGGGGSVRGSSARGSSDKRPSGDPVFATPRFLSIAQAMGVVPVVSAALGPVAGFPAARLAASHFSVMSEATAQLLIAGPKVVERALGHALSKEELGGAGVHAKSGAVDNVAKDEKEALEQIRQFLSYLPQNVFADMPPGDTSDPVTRKDEALIDIIPRNRRKPFKMRKLIGHVVDQESFFEIARAFGPGQITGLARLGGHPVGILANDCRYYAGAMTAAGSQKVRRFVDLCNTFRLPIVSLVDEPGFMIGPAAEAAGTIRHGTAAVMAVVQSRVPWISIIVRKAFGVAAAAHFGPKGHVLAWPSAETGALPLEGGVAVAFGREIAAADDPEAKRKELEDALAAAQSPFPRAETFSVHDLIDPRETRPAIWDWLRFVIPDLDTMRGPYTPTMRP